MKNVKQLLVWFTDRSLRCYIWMALILIFMIVCMDAIYQEHIFVVTVDGVSNVFSQITLGRCSTTLCCDKSNINTV